MGRLLKYFFYFSFRVGVASGTAIGIVFNFIFALEIDRED